MEAIRIRPDAPFAVGGTRWSHSADHQFLHKLPHFRFGGILLFVLGLLLQINVNVGGKLSLGEIILAPTVFVGAIVVIKRPGFFSGSFLMLWGLFFVSFCAYIFSDLLHGTDFHDASRGCARLGFLLIDFLAFYIFSRWSRFVFFPLSIGALAGQMALHFPATAHLTSTWKLHLSLQLAAAAASAICLYGRRYVQVWCALVFLAIGAVSFLLDSQSSGGICLASGALIATRVLANRRTQKLMPVILAAALAASGFTVVTLRNETRDQYGRRQQMSFAMRTAAIVTGMETIARNPLLGTGSWQTDFEAANRHRENTLLAGAVYDRESDNQAGHSQILQVWVEAGVFASIPFMYYLWRLLASLQWALVRRLDRFSAFAFFVLLNGIWSCLFSPFLGEHRILVGMTACVCVILADERNAARQTRHS